MYGKSISLGTGARRMGDANLAAVEGKERGPDVEGRLRSGPKKLMHPHRIQPLLIARVEEVK